MNEGDYLTEVSTHEKVLEKRNNSARWHSTNQVSDDAAEDY